MQMYGEWEKKKNVYGCSFVADLCVYAPTVCIENMIIHQVEIKFELEC